MGVLHPLRLGTVPYRDAWALQRRLAAARAAGDIEDCVLMLEHPPVYTLGRNAETGHLGAGVAALQALGAEVVEVDRGGSVTFHGPGQLVAYPLLALASRFPVEGSPGMGDVVAYVRGLEEALIATAAAYGVTATRREGYTGAWVGMEKLAAIGVKLASGVTQHGIALNVVTDLSWFSHVVPCGISDGGVCSLESLGAGRHPVADVGGTFAAALARVLGAELREPGAALLDLVGAPQPAPA